MISYLQKFNNLDIELREKVSGPKIMADMKRLEGKYRVSLATVIMRIMVRDISILDLAKFFMFEYDMEARHAESLVEEMKNTVLKDVAEYVGFSIDSAPSIEESDENDLSTWKNKQKSPNVRTSDFFFSTEDEEEVRNLAKKLENFKVEKEEKGETIDTVKNVEEIVEEVVKRINLSFSSDELSNRFRQIVNTYAKGVRNKIDTKATLMKEVGLGGMDLTDDLAIRVMTVIDKVKDEFKDKKIISKPKNIQLPEDTETVGIPQLTKVTQGRDTDYDFSQLKKKSSVISNIEEIYDGGDEEVNVKKEEEKLSYDDATKEDTLHLSPSVKEAIKPPIRTTGTNETSSGRVKMQDVKFVPKLVGPIDELRDMSLEDWRRLGGNSDEMVNKIMEKITFLEKESYKKRLEGIKAWRQSPVNMAYLKIGQTSMMYSKSLAETIRYIIDSGEKTLSIDEFNSVMELNKKLRF